MDAAHFQQSLDLLVATGWLELACATITPGPRPSLLMIPGSVRIGSGQPIRTSGGPWWDRPHPYRRSASSPVSRPACWCHRRHRYDSAENLEPPTVPVFADVVKGSEPRVDESAQVLTDCLSAFPIGFAEVARGILDEAVKTSPNVLSSISFQKAKSHSGASNRSRVARMRTVWLCSKPSEMPNRASG